MRDHPDGRSPPFQDHFCSIFRVVLKERGTILPTNTNSPAEHSQQLVTSIKNIYLQLYTDKFVCILYTERIVSMCDCFFLPYHLAMIFGRFMPISEGEYC